MKCDLFCWCCHYKRKFEIDLGGRLESVNLKTLSPENKTVISSILEIVLNLFNILIKIPEFLKNYSFFKIN